MLQFTLQTRDGSLHRIEGRQGISLMEHIRDAGFDELMALCGGCQSCATCHVYVNDLPADVQLPEPSIDEDELLDGSDHRQTASRLACQVKFDARMDGIRVVVAPPD